MEVVRTMTFLIHVLCSSGQTIGLTKRFPYHSVKRTYFPKSYHIIQEVQKYNIPDYRPRMEWFRKAVHKVRMIQRLKRSRGFAFSQTETGQVGLISKYDTTQ